MNLLLLLLLIQGSPVAPEAPQFGTAGVVAAPVPRLAPRTARSRVRLPLESRGAGSLSGVSGAELEDAALALALALALDDDWPRY